VNESRLAGGRRTKRETITAQIEYRYWSDPATGDTCFEFFDARVVDLAISGNGHRRRVADLGGGANPLLPLEFIRQHDLDYTVVDLSPEELAKAPPGYEKSVADVCSDQPPFLEEFDLVFSKTLAEHVADPRRFHTNVFAMLKPNGIAIHFFPTLFCLPFVVNRVLPHSLTYHALRAVAQGRESEGRHGKFPAQYRWCRGPSGRQLRRLEGIGFRVNRYTGYFGHGYYGPVRWLDRVHRRWTSFLVSHPVPAVTSFAMLELARPTTRESPAV
jgi:SAM-dependent methyltransferase